MTSDPERFDPEGPDEDESRRLTPRGRQAAEAWLRLTDEQIDELMNAPGPWFSLPVAKVFRMLDALTDSGMAAVGAYVRGRLTTDWGGEP
jgi:hypothetical protein